jgi:hypothetical protein
MGINEGTPGPQMSEAIEQLLLYSMGLALGG